MNEQRVQRRGKRGVILLIAAGLMFVLLAFVGLAFDVGYLQWSRRRAQTAADAAALAGAWAVQSGGPGTTEGKYSSKINGFEDGVNFVTVTINSPPLSGSYAGAAGAVEAIVSQDAPAFFMRILGFNILPVRARAVARAGYGTACIYVLDPTAQAAFTISGTTSISLGCGAIVASNATRATDIGGTASVTLTNGASIGSVGNYRCNGTPGPAPCSRTTPSYGISSGAVYPGDPLSTLPMPTPNATAQCFDGTGMVAGPCTGVSSGFNLASGTYQPGVYCGGITVNAGVTVSFSPGLYILAGGGGLGFSQGTVTASGVTFYITNTTGWPCAGLNGNANNPGAVNITSQTNLTLSAPTSGTYAGIAIFENRAITGAQASNATVNGGAGSLIDGALYFPNTDLSFAGNGDSSGYQMLVADTVTFVGGATLSLNKFPTDFATNNPAFRQWIVMGE